MDDARPGTFADLLRRLRNRAGLTQEELAARAGLTAKAVGALERGERTRPYPHTVRSLAQALALADADAAELTAAARPADGTPPADAPPPASLPAPVTPLVGRDGERAEAAGLLRSGTTRLLTLTGPGGVGKTALALEVARDVAAAFPAGTTVVQLAPVREARLVLAAVARELGVRQVSGAVVEDVAAFVGDGRRLLLLDNLEQVLDAAPDVAGLLARCPALAVLATSRAALRVRGELEQPLAPLRLPASDHPQDVARSAAGALFLDRARAAGAAVAVTDDAARDVAAICRRLDGLPLALELAAAHARLLPPAQLLARLDDAVAAPRSRDLPARQRTMRATLDWSHDLLTEQERVLLRRVSVFAGGFDLAAAGWVLGGDALVPLGGLVEQSLVVPDDGRYRLLEPVRGYAAARLAESGEGQVVADRAAELFLDLALRARAGLHGPQQREWLDLLRVEHANLGASLGRLMAAGRDGDAARLLAGVWLAWALSGSAVEGLDWLRRLGSGGPDPAGEAALHVATAGLRYASGDVAGALPAARAAAAAARIAGAGAVLTEALVLAGLTALVSGSGADELAEAATLAAAAGDRWAAAHAAGGRGQLLLRAGDLPGSRTALAEAETLARALGSPFTLATVLNARASLARLTGDDDGALELLVEAVTLAASIGTTWTLAYALPVLAVLADERGRPELAVRLFAAAAEAASRTVAYTPQAADARACLAALRERLGAAAFSRAWDGGRGLRPHEVPALAAQVRRPPAPS